MLRLTPSLPENCYPYVFLQISFLTTLWWTSSSSAFLSFYCSFFLIFFLSLIPSFLLAFFLFLSLFHVLLSNEICTGFSSLESSAIDVKLSQYACRMVSIRVPAVFPKAGDLRSQNYSLTETGTNGLFWLVDGFAYIHCCLSFVCHINFDAINRRRVFQLCKPPRKTGAGICRQMYGVECMAPISGACVGGFINHSDRGE